MITALDRQTSTDQLCTRIQPYGAGNKDMRVTLAETTRPASGTFVDPAGVVHSFSKDFIQNFAHVVHVFIADLDECASSHRQQFACHEKAIA